MMKIEISIESTYDTKLGSGPITTAKNWRNSPSLDGVGEFSFDMSIGDLQASLISKKRFARCYGLLGDVWTELGKAGIIDKIEVILEPDRELRFRVSGGDLLRELTYRTVGDLELVETEATWSTPIAVHFHSVTEQHEDDRNLPKAFDDNAGTEHEIKLWGRPTYPNDWTWIYVAYPLRVSGLKCTLGDDKNDNEVTSLIQYFNGSAWVGVSGFDDGTKVGSATLAQSGNMTFTKPAAHEKMTHEGVEAFWLRLSITTDAETDTFELVELDVLAEGPTTEGLADIMAFAPAGWSVDIVNGYATTGNAIYTQFTGENVLEALRILAELTGEHFRLGDGRKLVWIRNDPVDNPTACGYRAVPSYGEATEGNALICLIQSMAEIEDSYPQCSRVYPHGAGFGSTRVSLAAATDAVPSGYTLSVVDNYIKHDDTDSALRIDRDVVFPEIGLIGEGDSELVSNQLLAAGVEYLKRHKDSNKSYDLVVVGLAGLVNPGETIPVQFWSYVAGTLVLDIDATLVILKPTVKVAEDGICTTALLVSTVDAWPEDEAETIATHLRKAKRGIAGPKVLGEVTYETITSDDVDIGGGTIDGTVIGGNEPAAGSFTSLGATGNITVGGTVDGVDVAAVAAASFVTMSGEASLSAETQASTLAGDGIQWGTNVFDIDVSDFAGTSLEDDGSENLRIAASAAGVGLIGGGASALAVGAGTGITVNANDVAVNLGYAFTWTAKHIFRTTTTPQVEIGYDAAAYLSISQADGGDVTLATVSDGAGSMVLAPAGDILIDPAGNDMNPVTGYDINLGSLQKKYLTLHCAELWVETLVAQETIATIGGRILVGPTTVLLTDVSTTVTRWRVKHNEWKRYDIVYLEAAGKVEFLQIYFERVVSGVDVDADWFKVTGNCTSLYTAGVKFTIEGSTGNDGEWTVASSSYSNPDTTINVDEDITDDTADGWILYRGAQGGESFVYGIIRDKDGSGGNLWYAGDAVFNTGNTGDGFIDLYSVHGIKAAAEYGPSIVGNVRNSATYNDWTEHWAIGNLNGIYGYSSTTYGVAFGEYSATKAYITIDSTNGIRIMANNVLMGQWQPSGDVIFGQVATDKANLFWDQSTGTLHFRGGTDGTATSVRIAMDGGITISPGTAAGSPVIRWEEGTPVTFAEIDSWYTAGNVANMMLRVSAGTDSTVLRLQSVASAGPIVRNDLISRNAGITWESYWGTNGTTYMRLIATALKPGGNKTQDLGIEDIAWDDCWADDFHNQADLFYLDSRKDERGELVVIDDLATLCAIRSSGEYDARSGMALIDDSTLPVWALTRNKDTRRISRSPDGKPWLSNKMLTSLSWGAIRQLDGYRQALEERVVALEEEGRG